MTIQKFKLVTIIAEPILAKQIKAEIRVLGSSGVTSTEVSGEGDRNLNTGEVPGNKVKIECVVESKIALKIMEHISEKYFDHFSVITYSQDIEILRPEKFSKPAPPGRSAHGPKK